MKENKVMKASQVISVALLLLLFVPASAQQRNNMENGYEYVDLGLSVNWATCNIGAIAPEGYGEYYAWGETETKDSCIWRNYKYSDGADKMTKYSTKAYYSLNGDPDGRTTLELADDVAHVKLGDGWRMPTREEFMDYPPNASLFDFSYDHMNRWVQSCITDYYRCDGIPVRPVCPKNN